MGELTVNLKVLYTNFFRRLNKRLINRLLSIKIDFCFNQFNVLLIHGVRSFKSRLASHSGPQIGQEMAVEYDVRRNLKGTGCDQYIFRTCFCGNLCCTQFLKYVLDFQMNKDFIYLKFPFTIHYRNPHSLWKHGVPKEQKFTSVS